MNKENRGFKSLCESCLSMDVGKVAMWVHPDYQMTLTKLENGEFHCTIVKPKIPKIPYMPDYDAEFYDEPEFLNEEWWVKPVLRDENNGSIRKD